MSLFVLVTAKEARVALWICKLVFLKVWGALAETYQFNQVSHLLGPLVL